MCILCVVQKWSRKVATMLPWLVIPLIALWLLSQFLPPAFRFEITSPRLACVLVLLVTLFWYEILMPQLSSWRVRRNARLRERKRFEAIEMQKLKKTATRRCRNCLTPYREQNPSGGKFMCSYCGHISKRPVLDLSIPPGLGRLSNSGILKELVGKGGKMLNGKVWSDNNWICGQDWLENGGNWVNGSLSGKPSYLKKKNSGGFFFGGDDHLFSEKSYSFLFVFICKSLASIFLGIMWLWRKLFKVLLGEDDTSADIDTMGLSKKGEDLVNINESKSEKARRKAEEKRHARLEKEQLEEEERKQREEVAKLVEKLRGEKVITEKDQNKASNNEKREAERKRKKEKDRGSSKSNSDVDELEKRSVKETERNKKGGNENLRSNKAENGPASKIITANNHNNKGSVGTQYLDRMRGNFFPSSRTGGFFGKNTNANNNNIREHKSGSSLDHKKDSCAYGKSNAKADGQNHGRPVLLESQPQPPPKRSWQQLFTRSSTTTLSTNTNVISRPNGNLQSQTQPQTSLAFNNPVTFGLPYNPQKTPLQLSCNLPEKFDNFHEPCYVPDPASLIGPVSESLDNFQVDLSFLPDIGLEKPSPIESPMSRLHANSFLFPSNQEKTDLPLQDGGSKGWQMWNSSPICQDTLGLVSGGPTWYLPPELSGVNNQGVVQLQPQKTQNNIFMHATSDDPWASRTYLNSRGEFVYGSSNGFAVNHQFQVPHGSVWAKKEKSSVEGVGSASSMTAPVGGLYSTPDVQSLWSYE